MGIRLLNFVLLVALFCLPSIQQAPLVYAYPTTDDQWFYWGKTGDAIGQLVQDRMARLTQIRVDDPSIPTFSVSMVPNTGDYQSAWWWYYGYDAQGIGSLLSDKRLISIDPYFTSAGLRFAVVMMPNDGPSWWWYFGVDAAALTLLFETNNARPIALRTYKNNNARVFAVIMIHNTDADYKSWEWWYGKSDEFISGRIATGLRPITYSPDSFNGWVSILVDNEGEDFWWSSGLDGDQVLANLAQHHSRLIDFSTHAANGDSKFAVVEIDSNPYQHQQYRRTKPGGE